MWSTDQKLLRLFSGVSGQATLGPTHTFLFLHQSQNSGWRGFGCLGLSCSELNSAALRVEGWCLELGQDLRTFFCLSSLTNEVVHTCSTIGSNVEEIVLQKTRFLMWDLGGQEALRSSWDTYYSSTEVRRKGLGGPRADCINHLASHLPYSLSPASTTRDVTG